jgi:hypothetical protein
VQILVLFLQHQHLCPLTWMNLLLLLLLPSVLMPTPLPTLPRRQTAQKREGGAVKGAKQRRRERGNRAGGGALVAVDQVRQEQRHGIQYLNWLLLWPESTAPQRWSGPQLQVPSGELKFTPSLLHYMHSRMWSPSF